MAVIHLSTNKSQHCLTSVIAAETGGKLRLALTQQHNDKNSDNTSSDDVIVFII